MTISVRCPKPGCLNPFDFDADHTPYVKTSQQVDGVPVGQKAYTVPCPKCGGAVTHTTV